MAEHRCPICGAEVPGGAGFCPRCGAALAAPGLPLEYVASHGLAADHEVAFGARRPNPQRGALLVGVAAAILIAGGLIIGAGDSDDGDAERQPPATTQATPATTTERSTRTTVRRTTTTTAIPRYSMTAIPELAGQRVYAVVKGRVVRIDPAAGGITVLGERWRLANGWALIPRAGGVVLAGRSAAYLADDGSPPVELEAFGGPPWPAVDPAQIWRMSSKSQEPGSAATVELVDVRTGTVLSSFTLPALVWPVGVDSAGDVLVESEGGGIYALDSDGVARLVSDGAFRGGSGSHLVVVRCDDHLSCGHEIVDETTGQVAPLPIPRAELHPWIAVNPQGTHVAVVSNDELSVVDVASGEVREIPAVEHLGQGPYGAFPYPPVTWSLDGQHLLWGGSVLHILHVGADDPVEYVVTDENGTDVPIGAVAVAL